MSNYTVQKAGPFFWINERLIYNALPVDKCEIRASNKLDNPYSHERLFDDNFSNGEYIDYPRGRVIWDNNKQEAIIYIDPCILQKKVIVAILKIFVLSAYRIETDLHYHCKNCVSEILDI